MSRFITFYWPETRTVRCKHLITDHHVTILIKTEFEFCIGDDNTTAQCVVCTFFIESDCTVTKFGCVFFAFAREIFLKVGNALLVRNIFIMISDLSFCRWCIDWLWKLIRFF